jgi:hypothetical protein
MRRPLPHVDLRTASQSSEPAAGHGMAPARQLRIASNYLQRCREFIWMKSKWPRFALVRHASVPLNEVQAVRPPGVRDLGIVIEAIDQGGKFNTKSSYACSGHQSTLLFVARAAKQNLIADITLHLPNVSRMRF